MVSAEIMPEGSKLEATVASFLEKPAAIVIGMGFATNSTSRSHCICDAGFYDANNSMAIDQDLIDAMIEAGQGKISYQQAVTRADSVDVLFADVESRLRGE
mgnify:CR=1 FL=1